MKMLIKAMVLFTGMLLIGSCESSTESKKDMEPDSTTQNFTFTEYEFGDGGSSSYFNDVWIFDENNIWAVGDIVDDPVIGATDEYNIVQWNGSKWIGRGRLFNSSGIYGLWPVDSSHIFFAVGGVIEYKNQTFKILQTNLGLTSNQGIEHLWGSSESNIWGVGPWGTLVHYNGSKWTKLDFDTQYHIYAVTGIKETGVAYAVAWQIYTNHVLIIKLENSVWETVFDGYNMGLTSHNVEKGPGDELYLAGGFGDTRIWTFNVSSKTAKVRWMLPTGQSVASLSIYSDKDMYFFGDDFESGKMSHYNGKRLATFNLSKNPVSYGGSYAINNFAAYCGYSENKAFIIFIKRN